MCLCKFSKHDVGLMTCGDCFFVKKIHIFRDVFSWKIYEYKSPVCKSVITVFEHTRMFRERMILQLTVYCLLGLSSSMLFRNVVRKQRTMAQMSTHIFSALLYRLQTPTPNTIDDIFTPKYHANVKYIKKTPTLIKLFLFFNF